MLRNDAGDNAIVFAINSLQEDVKELIGKFEESRLSGQSERVELASRIATLEARVSVLSRIAWAGGGAVIALILETAVVLIGRGV